MRNILMAALIVLASTAALAAPAQAWGYAGHRIIGAIADLVLKARYPEAYKKLQAKLAIKDASAKAITRTLREAAVFADCAKNEKEFCGREASEEERQYALRNLEHFKFHYTDVPVEERRYVAGSAGTDEIDVVHMINYAVAQLRGKKPAKIAGVDLTDTEAIWLLAHLVGDIHQPLHVGAKYYDPLCLKGVDPDHTGRPPGFGIGKTAVETIGGNNIALALPPPAVPPAPNLHVYWDVAAVAQAMQAALTSSVPAAEPDFAAILAAKAPDGLQINGDVESWATRWASEVLPLAAEAHRKLTIRKVSGPATGRNGKTECKWETTLDKSYQDWAKGQARLQLAKAGFRLAALMKAIFDPEH